MVKILSRDAINRMVGRKSSVAGVGGGGGDVDLSGYATKIWTQETFVSIDFFRSLFRAYDSQNHEILPNDTTSTIDNIKAMFGFWTEQYLSALGQGSGGGGGGASALSDLLDVQLTNPTNGQALIYNSTLCKWVNGSAGTDMASVWENLAGATTEQINVSHLTNALSGYVTTSAISDMATETWVGQQGYATQTWVNDNYLTQTAASSTYLSIAFFNRLFQAYEGTGSSATRVNPNDTTSTIDNVKAMFGFWTEQYISALGQGTGGGGGGVGDVTWDLLADNSDTRQIALSHLTTALSGYALTSQLPTKVSQLTNDSGFITSLGDCFRYQGLVANDYVTGTTYSTITNGSYKRQLSGSSDSLLHFQIGGSASGLDIRFSYPQDNTNPLQYRKCIDSNRFAGGWVTLIDSLNIGSQSVSYATSAGNASTVGGYGEGSFLHRSGGTMTGAITMKANQYGSNYGIDMNNSDIVNANSIYTSDLSGSWDEGIEFKRTNGYYDSFRAADGTFYFGVNSGTEKGVANIGSAAANLNYVYTNELHPGNNNNLWLNTSTNMHIIANGPLIIPISNDVALSSYGRYALAIGGDPRNNEAHIGIDNNEIMAKGSASTTATLYLNGEGGTVCINETAGNCGIGTNSPSHKLHVNGGIYSTSYVTALSDARHKIIINDAAINVEQIAKMPAVVYRWNDGRKDNGLHVGSIAQDWQRILPEVVLKANDKEGTLSMQYGVAALVSSIITARKVVDHERRIAELERENKELKLKFKIA